MALFIYVVELLFRKYHSGTFDAIQFCVMPGKAVHLKIKTSKNIKIQPGQYVLIQCSQISNLEWHPFTVTQVRLFTTTGIGK